jgi:ABC-type dipeptide/oligopeptide/nickel transport system permease subunit
MTELLSIQDEVIARSVSARTRDEAYGWRRTWKRFRQQGIAMTALVVVGLIVLAAILAPVIARHDPALVSSDFLDSPSPAHVLGTDSLGHDELARVLFALRTSLLASLLAVALAVTAGALIGLVSGYLGGRVDSLLMRFIDALMAFPGLLMAMAVVGVLGPGTIHAMIGLSIAFTPGFARLVRGQVLAVREEAYVEAARVVGAGDLWIVRRHIVPNILSPLVVQALMSLGFALLAEGALSFLGLSVQPPDTSLGSLLQDGFNTINTTPRLVLIPGLMITILATCFNAIADGIRDALGKQELRAFSGAQA